MSFSHAYSPETRFWHRPGPFTLESGDVLPEVTVAYRSWGRLDARGSNGVLVCHALTGSADVDQWWAGVLGPGRALDPDTDFVLASNVLGGCYGTTGPWSQVPGEARAYGPDFPPVTIRDMVRLQGQWLTALGVRALRLVVGGSMGGMQALEWALLEPIPVDAVAALGAPAQHSPWAVGLSEVQRSAILTDPEWKGGRYEETCQPAQGLGVARMVAMCSYRSPESFQARFSRERSPDGAFQVEGYLAHHGQKLSLRFDANSYLTLTRAMDSHDLGRGRGPLKEVLGQIRQPALVLGIPTDVLYPPKEVRALADDLPNGQLEWLESPDGHDAFLIEQDQVGGALHRFRTEGGGERRRGKQCA
jgi:homoserine O-acetyltransferase